MKRCNICKEKISWWERRSITEIFTTDRPKKTLYKHAYCDDIRQYTDKTDLINIAKQALIDGDLIIND